VGDGDARVAVDACGPDRAVDAPEPEEFHRARADAGGARDGRGPGPALDDDDARAVTQNGDRGGETGRACADDEYVGGGGHTEKGAGRRRPRNR
jgi:hypothetical protein